MIAIPLGGLAVVVAEERGYVAWALLCLAIWFLPFAGGLIYRRLRGIPEPETGLPATLVFAVFGGAAGVVALAALTLSGPARNAIAIGAVVAALAALLLLSDRRSE